MERLMSGLPEKKETPYADQNIDDQRPDHHFGKRFRKGRP